MSALAKWLIYIMGAVLAAVSPAVVVPRMVRLMDEGYGTKEGITQLILAGASVEDVYVIVLFSTFVGMMQGEGASVLKFINIPVSIFLGIVIGIVIGFLLAYFFEKVHVRDTSKVLIILSISFLLVVLEDELTTAITFSALIAVMFIGIGLQRKREAVAKRLSVKYGKLWVAAEVFLFVLVGATVNVGYLGRVGVRALIVIVGALAFRMFGVFVCLIGTSLKKKERLFLEARDEVAKLVHEKIIYKQQRAYYLTCDFSASILLSSGSTMHSIVMKQILPPMTLETGSARNTPEVPMPRT